VLPDKKFKRVGDDIECTVMLTYPQLVFGSQIEIENIDGKKESLKIPKGCPSGERITIPGKGFPVLKSHRKGNLVVITQCHIPTKLSTDAKETLKKFSEQISTDPADGQGTISAFFKKFLG
jgi:molecular chaperone DnaJ